MITNPKYSQTNFPTGRRCRQQDQSPDYYSHLQAPINNYSSGSTAAPVIFPGGRMLEILCAAIVWMLAVLCIAWISVKVWQHDREME